MGLFEGMMPLTPWGMRKVRQQDALRRAKGAAQVEYLQSLTDQDKQWLADHHFNFQAALDQAWHDKYYVTEYR